MERLGDDAAGLGESAAAYYRRAQSLLMPPGAVYTGRETYEWRMEAFLRIQQKLYGLAGQGSTRGIATPEPTPEPPTADVDAPAVSVSALDSPAQAALHLEVYKFPAGLVVRVLQTFRDYDGQEIRAGEVLHFNASSYFPYDAGHTLYFAEKTIRLSDNVDEHVPILANAGNAWFQPLAGEL